MKLTNLKRILFFLGVFISSTHLNAQLQPGCTNIGFDNGDFTGWYGTYGMPSITTGPIGAANPTYIPNVWGSTVSTQHNITAGAGVDPFGGFPVVYPGGGTNSMILGDGPIGGWGGASIEQQFSVTAANAVMVYSYALVIQDANAANPHLDNEQPFFNIEVLDCNGLPVACGAYHVVGGPGIPGFTASLFGGGIYYKGWTDVFLDFTPYIGSCVTVRFTVVDCSLGGHWAYAYLDASCAPAAITGVPIICPGDSTTLFAPPGGAAYAWTPGGETTDSIVVSPSALANYTCTVTSVAGPTCTTILNYQVDVHPPALITVDSSTICIGDQTTLTATPNSVGGTYLWAPGGATTPAINVSPAITTPYTCTFTDINGCEHDSIGLVTVNPLPTAIDQVPAALCEDVSGGGTVANVDLTALNVAIDGGTGTTITWFTNSATTIPVPTPATATVSNNDIFYALVDDGNCFDTATVTYTVIALPNSNAGVDDTVCVLNYNLNATASLGAGLWTPLAGVVFGTPNSPTSSVSSATPGTYQLIWTEDNGNGCIDADTVNITLLTPIATSVIEDCTDSSATITITNGLPEIDGSLYTASNLLPATANFVNTTATHNGTITINGLLNGNAYSIDIIDGNGCTATFNGGPYVGGPASNAGVDDTVCALTYNLNATPSLGVGAWSGPAGINFGNTASPTSSVSTATAGTYQLIWTENNGGCIGADTINITFNILSVPNTPTNPTCFGSTNGQIILAPQSSGGATTHTYQWDAAANNQTLNPATNLPAGAFTVRVTDGFGCFVDSTFTLTEPQPFTYTPDFSNANCNMPDGWIAVLNFAGGTGPYTYDWGAGPTTNDSLLNLIPGVYTVTVTDAVLPIGCDTTFNITVGNNLGFTASITNPVHASCNGFTDGSATANGSDPLVAYTYLWDAAAANQTTQTASNLGAGNYLVTITDPNTGCTDTASITITQPTIVTVSVTPDTICLGQTANLTATGANGNGAPYTYNWDAGAFIGSPYSVSPTATTTYSVVATDANNCPSLPVNVDVVVSPGLIVTLPLNRSICIGESTSFTAIGSFGNGDPSTYVYTWDNGLPNGATQNVSPTVTTTYNVTLNDGCTTPSATAQITVTVNPLPIVNFFVDDRNACESAGQLFTFHNVPGATDSILTWNFGDGSNVTGLGANFNPSVDTVTHVYPAIPGSYDVTLTVTSTSATGQCSNSLTKPGYITIYNDPIADFTINPNPTTMLDPTINFFDVSTTISQGITDWGWNIANLDSSTLQNPSYTFPEDTGHYLITLTIVDFNGCTSTITKTAIVTGEYGIFVPNAFTPDNDDLNEGFHPKGFGIDADDYSFYIFNRWGELLYETHTKFNAWDGSYKGEIVQNGVYVWKLEFKDINGKQHKKIGKVSLIK